jgi:Fe2+ or Zn2+ uptake regulation protein/predicted O-methyltransferase YrrM
MSATEPLVEALGEAGYRLTEPGRVVAELVAARAGHFTANDLIAEAQARDLGIGRATIFRALDLFTDLQLLERIDLPGGDHAYVPCLPGYHHHHLICGRCARVTEVEDLGLGGAIAGMERNTGWTVQKHRLELYGLCPECQKAASVERWNERYSDRGYLWAVEPNQFVERHLSGLEPGTAVDLAAGEGRNAVWLARAGWHVMAVDFSQTGLDKAARLAAASGVAERVVTVNADALAWAPAEPVDLVVIAYLQLPPAQVRTALEHARTWLRPGGRVFVVAHDRTNIEHGYGGPPSPDRCYDLDETVEALSGLEIDLAEVAERHVETEDGPRIALDTLVIARRPAA